jgi:hypothetical protein
MSTRYIKRDNVRIIGLAKNASQAIKQVALRNNNWELYNEIKDEEGLEEFVNHYDKNVVVYFPIRDEMERAKSELVEWIISFLHDHYDIVYDSKQLTEVIDEEYVEEVMRDLNFHPHLEYFRNATMRIFLEEILFNEDWNGCRVRFFDVKKFSSHLPKYLGYDDTEIPYYNIATKSPVKRIILRHLTDEKWKKKRCNILTKEWQSYYRYIGRPFWNGIKKSKYWIEL